MKNKETVEKKKTLAVTNFIPIITPRNTIF